MCYETVTWAVKLPLELSVHERLVLIYLSEHRNHETGQCNPSVATLATEIPICRRSIQTAIKSLTVRRLIVAKRTGKSNWYTFRTRGDMAAPLSAPRSRSAPSGKLVGVKS